MRTLTINENEKEDNRYLVYKRRFIFDAPRLVAMCRLRGHNPTRVDLKYGSSHYYECKRCGTRPTDQYTPDAPWNAPNGGANLEYWVLPKKLYDSWSLNFKVGSSGSERTFAGHVTCPVFGVYWGVEGYGDVFRRMLNGGDHYDSREIAISFHEGRFNTKIWAKRNSWSSSDPWWMHGSFSVSDFVFGKRVSSREVVDTESVLVPMPEGSYPATAKLERFVSRRARAREDVSYIVDIDIDDPIRFIPVPGKGENSWDCGDDGVWALSAGVKHKGGWAVQGIAKMVESALRDRERYASRDWVPNDGWSERLVKA